MALPSAAAEIHSADSKRVKVYELRENDWYDRGTGFCAATIIQEDARISVESEDDPERILLEVRLKKEDVFQRQQETLIVWTDTEGIDMALSFQEADGCGSIWTTIGEVQQRLPDGPDDAPPHPLVLPVAQLGKLDEVDDMIRRAGSSQPGRDALTKLIIAEKYIESLGSLVEIAEDLEDLASLHKLCNIMKALILFNESSIIEHVVRDEAILGVVGALEYDPDFPTHRANHRQFLSDASKFKEVVSITSLEIRQRIHFTYRLQYLKDVVLARILDDPTFNVLNGLIFFHQVDIVQHIQSNTPFLKELFSILSSNDASPQQKKDVVLFVQQACAIAKTLQAECRSPFYQNLVASGLFSAINFALQHNDAPIRVAGTDILVAIIDHDAPMMRTYIFKSVSDKTKPMTDTLIELLLVETDLGVKAQIADAIKVLLDPNVIVPSNGRAMPQAENNNFLAKLRNSNAGAPTEAFLQSFYDQSAKKLFQPLKDLEHRKSVKNLSIHEVSLFSHLVEILSFFLRQHTFRSKFYILTECLAARVAQLLSSKEKHLKLTALKYFRTCIALSDEFYHRHLVAQDVFAPLLAIITATMPRDNLLNSAVLELFEHIKKEGVKVLIIHLAEKHRSTLASITYVSTFEHILLHYDQIVGAAANAAAVAAAEAAGADATEASFATSEGDTPGTRRVTVISGGGGRWQGLPDEDAETDAYFNASDGEDDDAAAPTVAPAPSASPAKPLVDYGEDDDDDYDGSKPTTVPAAAKPASGADDRATAPAMDGAAAAAAAAAAASPPAPLAEKRRRSLDDDEGDDALTKLVGTSKRRSSDASWTRTSSVASATSSVAGQAGESDGADVDDATAGLTRVGDAGAAADGLRTINDADDGDANDKAAPWQPLRRKSGSVGGVGGRRIAISLGGSKGGLASKEKEKERP